MADFEENQENGNEIEGEGEPEMDEKTEEEREEEKELKQKEIDKLKAEFEKIKEDNAKTLERLEKLKAETPSKGTARKILDFVSKTAASAFIFLSIATLYNKMQTAVGKSMSKRDRTKISKEAEFFKVVSKINMLENKLSNVIATWFDNHKDENITLEGVSVKLVAMFETVLATMSAALLNVHNDAETLSGKIQSNVSWKCMNVSDVALVTSDSESVIKSMKELKTLVYKHLKKSRSLQTLLDILSKEALDDLDKQQNIINKMLLE